jgi:hypothetical protein
MVDVQPKGLRNTSCGVLGIINWKQEQGTRRPRLEFGYSDRKEYLS